MLDREFLSRCNSIAMVIIFICYAILLYYVINEAHILPTTNTTLTIKNTSHCNETLEGTVFRTIDNNKTGTMTVYAFGGESTISQQVSKSDDGCVCLWRNNTFCGAIYDERSTNEACMLKCCSGWRGD